MRGSYQYFEPDEDLIAQADLLLQTEGTLDADDLPPTLDVETVGTTTPRTPQQMAAEVKQWVDYVGAATGKTPIIYVGQYFWMDQVGGADQSANPLWEAQYRRHVPDRARAVDQLDRSGSTRRPARCPASPA